MPFSTSLLPGNTLSKSNNSWSYWCGSDICCSVCFCSMPFSSSLLPDRTISKSNDSCSHWCGSDICCSMCLGSLDVFLRGRGLQFVMNESGNAWISPFVDILKYFLEYLSWCGFTCLSSNSCTLTVIGLFREWLWQWCACHELKLTAQWLACSANGSLTVGSPKMLQYFAGSKLQVETSVSLLIRSGVLDHSWTNRLLEA